MILFPVNVSLLLLTARNQSRLTTNRLSCQYCVPPFVYINNYQSVSQSINQSFISGRYSTHSTYTVTTQKVREYMQYLRL